ncbi:hypothetical protein EGW08_008744, partial [Elysia chlorotica]
ETRQVVFAKVHKAASSTVQNILLRFAMARNLSVLLPRNGPVLSQTSSKIERSRIVPHIQGKQLYDILCSHVLYEAKEIDKYFPKNAFRVAIFREPIKQVLSALMYHTSCGHRYLTDRYRRHKLDPINAFFKHSKDFNNGIKCPNPETFLINRMSYDLGINISEIDESKANRTTIDTFVKDTEHTFNLVLISDFFDESMVLLGRTLKWSMKDIIYIKVNAMHF